MNNVFSEELKARLLKAGSEEEAAEIAKESGAELSAEEVRQLCSEIRNSTGAREVSVDELEAASGGADRDWVRDGCASTVEYGSWCGSNDKCMLISVTYDNMVTDKKCPKCGGTMYNYDAMGHDGRKTWFYKCTGCGTVMNNHNEVVADFR